MTRDNLSEAAAALAGDEAPAKPLAPRGKATKAAAKPAAKLATATEKKVRIMLEDNDQIPPGGQFIAVNGRSFLIQAGHEVDVPESVVDVLNHAVMSVPIRDEMQSVIGYKDRLRFPYRVITSARNSG